VTFDGQIHDGMISRLTSMENLADISEPQVCLSEKKDQ